MLIVHCIAPTCFIGGSGLQIVQPCLLLLSTSYVDLTSSTVSRVLQSNPPPAAVVFVFAEPMYLFVENVGTGQVCVEKIGNTTQTLRVMISGGWSTLFGYSNQEVVCLFC